MSKTRSFAVLDRTIVHKNQWIEVQDWTTDSDGQQGLYTVVKRPGGVYAILVSAAGEIVFIRQYRFPAGEYSLELPGGGIDDDEQPIDAVTREVREETGLQISDFTKIGCFRATPALTDQQVHVFLASFDRLPEGHQANDEIISRHVIPRQEVAAKIANGEITDSLTLSSLMCLQAYEDSRQNR